jgi:hypothetical protein
MQCDAKKNYEEKVVRTRKVLAHVKIFFIVDEGDDDDQLK